MTQPGQPGYDPTINDWGTTYDAAENPLKHGIDESVPGGAFAAVRDPAWHRLGKVHEGQVTASTLLVSAYADYPVFLVDDYAIRMVPVLAGDGKPMMVGDKPFLKEERALDPYKKKICRMHPHTGALQVLGTSSPTYQPITNRELFVDFADMLIDAAEPTVSTCGVLYDGRQAFMSFKLPGSVTVGDEDASELWLVAHTSHDLSRPATVAIVPIRTVCQNTLRVGLTQARSRWSIKHTKNAKLVLQQAKESLKLGYKYADEWVDVMEKLAMEELTTTGFDQLITDLWGPDEDASKRALDSWDERRGKLLHLFKDAPTAAGQTAWGGLNAVGEFCDWETKVAAKSFAAESGTGGDDALRFWRSLDGEKSVTTPKTDMLHALVKKIGDPELAGQVGVKV